MYGLRQAPSLFNLHLNTVLGKLDYTQSLPDPCVYVKRTESDFSMLIVVVDDIILQVTSSKIIIDSFSSTMDKTYDFKDPFTHDHRQDHYHSVKHPPEPNPQRTPDRRKF